MPEIKPISEVEKPSLQDHLLNEHARLVNLLMTADPDDREKAQELVLIVAQLDTAEGREFLDADQFRDAYLTAGRMLDRGSEDDEEDPDDEEGADGRALRIFWSAVIRTKYELSITAGENRGPLN